MGQEPLVECVIRQSQEVDPLLQAKFYPELTTAVSELEIRLVQTRLPTFLKRIQRFNLRHHRISSKRVYQPRGTVP